jgi:hypothetical protein
MNELPLFLWLIFGVVIILVAFIIYDIINDIFFRDRIRMKKIREKEKDRIYEIEKDLFKIKHKDNPLFDEYVVTIVSTPFKDQTVKIENQYYGHNEAIYIDRRMIQPLIKELLKYRF